jgi:1,2-diacylglycerol-3-alpha-glucose alpha-1,2-glucosyltransferase
MKQRIVPISNGVDLTTFKFNESKRKRYRKEFGLEEAIPFSVGHVFARKGVKTFVDVAKRMDNQFIWFGKIYNKFLVSSKEIENMVDSPPKNVQFTGFVDDIVAAYCAGDILFFPSLAETQGIVVLEAMAMGRPVVVRKLPVYDGWLHEGKDCMMCSNDNEFIDTIKRLEEDKKESQMLVKNASETIKEHSLDLIGKQLKGVYESLK